MTYTVSKYSNLIKTILLVSIWVHISEVFRYFIFVIPALKNRLSPLEGIAEMNWTIFSIWGLWDTILTALIVIQYWLISQHFGQNLKSIVISSLFSWSFFFLLFWIGMLNMGLSDMQTILITLPLSLFEVFIATYLSQVLVKRLN